ncbi:MAG: hypothetical protein R3B93_07455 [Bacteroidia bacterium]
MILIIPVLACILLVAGLMYLARRISRESGKIERRIFFTSLALFLVLGFFYFSFLFGIALNDHHDVKRGTFLWYVTMDNPTITEFPVIFPNGEVVYNSIGGDSPNIGTGWEIEYESIAGYQELIHEIVEYLESEGYEMREVDKTQYYTVGKYKKSESITLFSGTRKNGGGLDLMIKDGKNDVRKIVCSIIM